MTDKVKWRDAKHLHEKIAKLTEARARDAETIKAAEALAIVALNTQCATQEDADRLAAAVTAFRAAQESKDD